MLAKASDQGGYGLARHGLDVACAVERLLTATGFGARLSALAGRPALSAADRDRLAVLGGLHDVGKTNHRMQATLRGERTGPGGHVAPLVDLLTAGTEAAALRDRARAALRYDAVAGWFAGAPDVDDDGLAIRPALAWRLALGHHGGLAKPPAAPTPERRRQVLDRWSPRDGVDPIAAMGDLVDRIAEAFPAAFDPAAAPLPSTAAFAHAVAGLLILADRLASTESAMAEDAAGPADPAESRARLAAAVARALGPAPAIASLPDWDLLLDGHPPRPAQAAIDALPLGEGPGLHILEAPTGAGKTEAALRHYLRLRRAGAVDGLYFALPTRAAAVQLHRRLGRLLAAVHGAGGPPVLLAVPGYLAPGPAAAGSPLDRPRLQYPDAEAPGLEAWPARHAGTFLAAPLAVGTIDQVLLGALDVRASHLRGVTALRPLLVVDEVHASDPYMTGLLDEVLDRLAAAAGHALLLSATLGAETRRRLLRRRGADAPRTMRVRRKTVSAARPAEAPAGAAADPPPRRAALWSAGREAPVWQDAGDLPDRTVALALDRPPPGFAVADPPSAALAALAPAALLAAARAGARVLVIRNTVAAAVATQRALEAAVDQPEGARFFRVDGVAAPHHGRFAPDDRRALDAALEAALGRQAPEGRGLIAVASQTAEQSLDIDADLLVTDLCPADVLIQRIGRLHRHVRPGRPAAFKTPTVRLLAPTWAEIDALATEKDAGRGPPRPGLVGLGPAGASVYELTRAAATLAALEAEPPGPALADGTPTRRLVLPARSAALVEAATDPDTLAAFAAGRDGAAGSSGWRRLDAGRIGIDMADRQQAALTIRRWSAPFPESWPEATEVRLASRLGAHDRLLRFDPDRPPPGPFGTPVAALTVPDWLARKAVPDPEAWPVEPVPEGAIRRRSGGVTVDLGAAPLTYDRLGLRLAASGEPEPEV